MATKVGTLAAVGNTVVATVGQDQNLATFFFYGTYTGANITFEVSPDGTNWFLVTASSLGANSAVTATGALSALAAYDAVVAGTRYVRARLTAITTGAVSVTIATTTSQIDPTPAVPTHAVTSSGTWNVVPSKATTGGLSRYLVVSAATNNAAVVKATAGTLYAVHLTNTGAATRYVKFYQKATAPAPATDTAVLVFAIPAGQQLRVGLADLGDSFTTGIGIAIVAGAAGTDNTAIGANEVVGAVHYA